MTAKKREKIKGALANGKSISKRRGKIRISKQYLDAADPKLLKVLFERFFPLHISYDHLYSGALLEYAGYSEHFEEIEPGTALPLYDFHFHIDDKDVYSFVKCEKAPELDPSTGYITKTTIKTPADDSKGENN